jgi:hypothetical protein
MSAARRQLTEQSSKCLNYMRCLQMCQDSCLICPTLKQDIGLRRFRPIPFIAKTTLIVGKGLFCDFFQEGFVFSLFARLNMGGAYDMTSPAFW